MASSTGERRPQEFDELTNVAAPSKRRKLDACSSVAVKRERSPSPPLIPTPRSPQTSGVTFLKYPTDCSPPHPNWKTNRSRCLFDETARLQALGLTITRRLIRDDGLAFDWSSEVPVDCVTLKPPPSSSSTPNASQPAIDTVQSTRETSQPTENPSQPIQEISQPPNTHPMRDASQAADSLRIGGGPSQPARSASEPRREPTQAPNNSGNIPPPDSDLLGHALQDQVTTSQAGESSEPAVEPAAPDVTRLLNIDRSITTEAPSSDPPEFTVVGAAIKDTALPADQQPPASLSSPKEYRRLIPTDLRIYQHNINNKFPYRINEPPARRKRRIEWIEKEIAKIEGYTGEKVSDHRYDGNYVIITLESKNRNKRKVSNYRPPSRPIPISPNANIGRPLPILKLRPPNYPPGNVARHANTAQSPAPVVVRLQQDNEPPLQSTTCPTPPSQTRSETPAGRHPPQRSSLSSTSSTQTDTPVSSAPNAPVTFAQPSFNVSAACTSNTTRAPSPPISISSEDSDMLPSPRSLIPPLENTPTALRRASSERLDLGNIESRGLQFLERYLMLYDANRQDIASAFTPNATFTLTDDGTKPRQVVNSPSAIGQAIQNFDDDDVNPGAMMLTCEGTVVPRDHSTPTHTFSRTFILRRNTNHDWDLWPLKIAAERLTLKRI